MGKSNKLYKSGLPRNQLKKSSNKQLAKIKINPESLNQNNPSSDISQKPKIKYLPFVNYNLDAMKKANETLGLSQDEINSLYKRPLRNRRRKMKKELKQQMEDKTKLDITLNPNLHFRNKIEENDLTQKNLNKKDNKNKINKTTMGFNFEEMNGLINDMVEDNENNIMKENIKNKSSTRNKNQRKIIYNEANEINNILTNKEFIKERNEKIREEFNKNYNLLNLK